MADKENDRQILHMVVGLVAIAMLLFLGRGVMIALVFSVLIIGTVLINLRIQGRRISFVDWFVDRFERDGVMLPGWGSACYAMGVLIILTVLQDAMMISACIYLLAVGDAFSTMIGRRGRMRIPYNKAKTLEGMAAFFLTSLPAYVLIGPLAIPLALVGALAETVPRIDDNITIPLACASFLLVAA